MSVTKVIKSYVIKNWLGITEKSFEPGKVNIVSGHKGAGKTSLIEGFEMALTGKLDGKERRTELIRHGEKEATLFVELSDGLTVDRRLRAQSSDYLKVSKPDGAAPSTEGFLRSLVSGDIFRPGEFLKKKPEEQAAIILNMLEIPWTKDDIQKWFGEVPEVNYEMHILKILKQIEDKYYKERAAINQQIDVLKAQAKGYKDQLPANYDGEAWRSKKVQEYYGKVAEAEEINKKIVAANNVIEGLESRIATIKATAETDKQTKKNVYDRQRSEGREFIQFLNQKIEKLQAVIDGARDKYFTEKKSLEDSLKNEKAEEEIKYQQALQALKVEHENKIKAIADSFTEKDSLKIAEIAKEVDTAKEELSKNKESISVKEQEIVNIDELEKQSIQSIDEKTIEQIKTVDAEAGNSKTIIETMQPVDVEPLKKEADEVAQMQSYLRDFDLMKDIQLNKIAPKAELSANLTAKIDKARSLPLDLLKISKCPIEGVTVDSEGLLRINDTLISGLSDGEMKDLAVKIAKNRAENGELKIICFDGFQDLNAAEQKKIIEEAKHDGYQWFFLVTDDGDLKIDIIDNVEWETEPKQISLV
jgi:DNA repair exonuclease SbcCD ATPase subunit